MSTETTNKKIKIDNGTTFGRTYTDKAVDELLKNVGGGGISVIELTNKNGTIASAQLGEINANPQNFAFKYNGKILLFTSAGSTTYQYCNNNTTSSDNNVMTTSTLLTIESSTGVYTISENAHNVAANSIHPVNGGDLTNIQVGSKVYSIPSGGFNIFDNAFSIGVAENINEETFTLTGVGLNKINSMFTNGKLLGLCLEDPANITTDFTFVPFISLTGDNYCFGATTYIAGTNVKFTLIKINKITGAIEMIQKLMAATDAQ